MNKPKAFKDPHGHNLPVHSDVYDSAAFAALNPHDVLALAFTDGAGRGTDAHKAAAQLIASAARILRMTLVCVAVACTPAACAVLTGYTPTYCGEGCQDV